MIKTVKILTAVFCLIIFTPGAAKAASDFESSYRVEYRFLANGDAHVSQNIALTNKSSLVFASRYFLSLQGGEVENISASDEMGPIAIKSKNTARGVEIELIFNQQAAGKGETLNFRLEFDQIGLANLVGQIWEVNLPKIADFDEIGDYQLTVLAPSDWGQLAYSNPKPRSEDQKDGLLTLFFDQNLPIKSGVRAAFGNFQIFDFTLNYHLKNSSLKTEILKIALPPDTAYQRVFYREIKPLPQSVETDEDGNWLASYSLAAGERLNISAVGGAKVFSQPIASLPNDPFKLADQTLALNKAATDYWPADHPRIKTLASGLATPAAIYHFVVQSLDYDLDRVKKGASRFGALETLENPGQAICTEFTDLFVALARAASIPAREVNGFAYTTNPQLRPLSLVSDVLHSWPEYYDEDNHVWVPVDPTWEKTTGGVDYFSKFDMNHLVFVIHGVSDRLPLPAGAYKTERSQAKDVQVNFGQYRAKKSPQIEAKLAIDEPIFSEFGGQGQIIIKNLGPEAIYELPINIESANLVLETTVSQNDVSILPFGQAAIPFSISARPLSIGSQNIKVVLNNQDFGKTIRFRSLILERALPLLVLVLFLTFGLQRVKTMHKRKKKK